MKGDDTPVTGGIPLPDHLVYKENEMSKSPEMEKFLDRFAKVAFGRSRSECIRDHFCVICGQPAHDFEDMLSRREFAISGMCQKCQDKTFDEPLDK